MPQKPETTFIAKLKRHVLKQYPDAFFRKHADQFTHGVPDLEIILPGDPIAIDCWFEVKWMPSITRQRKIQYRPLQKEELERRAALGVPCGLIVGTPKGIAWFHGLHLPTHVIIADIWDKNFFDIDMFLDAHYGLISVKKLLPDGGYI